MFQTIANAFRIKDVRKKLLYTIFILIIVRIGCQLPLPGMDKSVLDQFMTGFMSGNLGFLNALTGSSLSNMSVFALNITVYITASIIIQLLTIAFPRLEEMQKDGEDGRKKISKITRYLTAALAVLQSTAMVIGFGNQGIFGTLAGAEKTVVMISDILLLSAGAMVTMWLGELITDKGIGNGISIILLVNILSTMPNDFVSLYEQFIKGASGVGFAVLAGFIIVALFVGMIVFIVYLDNGMRKIPVQYSQKMSGRRSYKGQQSSIPMKVNTAGVIPIIFAASIFQFPILISRFVSGNSAPEWTRYISSSFWFNPDNMKYSVGFLLYAALIIFFAYFYTQITFNPADIANTIKRQGGVIPGIRPGKSTEQYLANILKYLICIGAIGMIIVAAVPIIVSGVFRTSLSFAGTSLIIVVGVILETAKKMETMMIGRNYKGFLAKD